MTLRKKILIIIISTSLLLTSLINASSHFILVKSFSDLEQEYCIKNIQRALSLISSENSAFLTIVNDYAVWDDSYAFAEDLNPEYIKSNLLSDTFTSLNLNFFIFSKNSGQPVASFGYDLVNKEPLPVSAEILNLILKNQFFHNPNINTKSVGFIIINNVPIYLAYSPILTSTSTGPPHGSLIMGRILNKDYAVHISETTQSPIQIEPFEDSSLSRELKEALPIPGNNPQLYIKTINPQTIAGYAVINDLFGKPALILRTEMERDIYNHGYNTIMFFIYVVFFGTLFFFISAYFLLDKQVIARIVALAKSVSKVRLSGTLVDRVPVKGKDEISSLAGEINEMLQSLELADQELRFSHDELEKRVETRTAELVLANNDLNNEIAEHELGQKALFGAYNEIHLILNSVSSIMIGVDDEHMVTQWNDIASKILGLESADVIGLDFFSLPISWEWEKISQKSTECTTNNMKVILDDIVLGNPGENARILGITMTPLFLENRNLPGFLLTGADITERRMLEQQLGRSSKLEAIGQLAAGVAHEINTPTQLVGSNLRFLGQSLGPLLELIEKIYKLNSAVKHGTATPEMANILEKETAAAHLEYFRQEAPKAIEQSLEGIDRITHIVNAMRFFSHPGSETKEMANLNQIIQNALSLSRNEWKNIVEIKTDFAEDLPNLECLPSELSQVMLNLIINSVHAIQDVGVEETGVKGQITITTRQIGEMVEVRIADNGTGIPEEIRSKIFDPFFTTKDVGRGTGQGLAIAYAVIVKKHRGTLEFESELGRGTTFIIRIPRKANDD